ncbi:MAG TPA: hypothetical protein PLS03_08085 [Terrimicrobiaceae bacterium]|nr:hypothetical protein [Terrimicrobiaceae bacterium]
MEFAPELGFWSPFIFWFCLVNAVLSILFTLVVIVGGISDLKYLFRALKEETVDEADDGRVQPSSTEHSS